MKTMKTVKNEKEISKRQLARELSCSPGTISKLVASGVIEALPSGKINRTAALQAIVDRTSGSAGGWGEDESPSRGGRVDLRSRAKTLLESEPERLSPDIGVGMAWLAITLRDENRFNALTDLLVDVGVTPDVARKAALGLVCMVSFWIEEPLTEALGKQYWHQFDRLLANWIKTFPAESQAIGKETVQ